MRDFLAEKLLVKIMEWDSEEISRERPLLQALAFLKYNEYLQFSIGMRFIDSLGRWLNQFGDIEERKIAYRFIMKHLVFISNVQISYLVSIAFNEKIKPILINKTAQQLSLNQYKIKQILGTSNYNSNLRKSLFIGLSDGAKIDYLRRCSNLDNEQVTTTHEISEDKLNDMLNELIKSEKIDCKFDTVFLIDDFTASGKSYIRLEETKGKIYKFLDKVSDEGNYWDNKIDKTKLDIHVLFYIATTEAITNITEDISSWKENQKVKNNITITVDSIQTISGKIKEQVLEETDFLKLAEKYFDEKIIDEHYKKGKHEKPYLGFNECALPVVLNHNTPNNTLPLFWFSDDSKVKGLFPRITRHKSNE